MKRISIFEHEVETKKLFSHPHDGDLIDVGANVGAWSVPMAQYFRKVFAFEPNPDLRVDLRANARANNIPDEKLEIIPYAVSSKHEAQVLYDYSAGFNTAHFYKIGKDDEGMEVECVSLDEFLPTTDAKPALIKVDTEGWEWHVLFGARKTIEKYNPELCVELHPPYNDRLAQPNAIWQYGHSITDPLEKKYEHGGDRAVKYQ